VLARLIRSLEGLNMVGRAAPRRSVRRSMLIGVLLGTPLSALFLWLAIRGIRWNVVWDAIESVSLPWLAGVALGFAGTYAFFTLRWSILVNAVGPVRRRRLAAYVLSGAAINNVVPGRPGELVRGYWAARSAGASALTGMGTVVVDRALDVVILAATLVTVTPLVSHPEWLDVLLALSIAGAACLGAALVLAARRTSRIEIDGPNQNEYPAGIRARLRTAVDAFMRGLATIRSPREAAALLVLTLGAWASWALAAWCCMQAVGISPGLLGVIFLTVVVNLGVSIPSSSGFVGTYQWLCVSALSVFSIGRSDAFAFAVVLHAMSLIPVTILGYALLAWMAVRRAPMPREVAIGP
jgi:glycosyltransferase 2 family protein